MGFQNQIFSTFISTYIEISDIVRKDYKVPHTVKILPNPLLQPWEVLMPDNGNILKKTVQII